MTALWRVFQEKSFGPRALIFVDGAAHPVLVRQVSPPFHCWASICAESTARKEPNEDHDARKGRVLKVWTVPLKPHLVLNDSPWVRHFLVENDNPHAGRDPRMRVAEYFDVVDRLDGYAGTTFFSRRDADEALFVDLSGGGFGISTMLRETTLDMLEHTRPDHPHLPEPIGPDVVELLGVYVYALRDPRTQSIFYIGKGQGNRIFDHVWSAMGSKQEISEVSQLDPFEVRTAKTARIRDIYAAGEAVDHLILRHQIRKTDDADETAYAIEQTLIDAMRLTECHPDAPTLTNVAGGHTATPHRAQPIEQLLSALAAPELTTTHPLLLVTLKPWGDSNEAAPGNTTRSGFGFKHEWRDPRKLLDDIDVLGDSLRCWWRIDTNRVRKSGIHHAVAVHNGITRALFEIVLNSWERNPNGRHGFRARPVLAGPLFDKVVGPHGHRLPDRKRGDQTSITYWPKVNQRTTTIHPA